MKIKANDIKMNYEISGDGPCLVLIHGFSDNLNMWFNQAPQFSERYKALRYDVRGFGQTDWSPVPYTIELVADDLHALLKKLDIEKACVLGYSMGGGIALTFALKYPEMATGIVFANSGIGEKPSDEMVEQRKMAHEIFKQGNIEVIADLMAVASFSPDFQTRNPEAYERYKEIKMQNDPADYYDIMQAIIGAIDNPPDLARLACPALIIAGSQDGFMDVSVGERMKEEISDAELVVMPTGHAAAIEMPDEFNKAVLDFLDSRIQE